MGSGGETGGLELGGRSREKGRQLARVFCYSGSAYAERPVAFSWRGERLNVVEILRRWREPSGPVFEVTTESGVFRLAYNETDDSWRVTAERGS